MSDHGPDHIYAILIAFLASLACFTVLALIGSDQTPTGKLGDVVVALAGIIGGFAYKSALTRKKGEDDDDVPSSS